MTIWEWLDSGRGQLIVSGAAGSAVSALMEYEGIRPTIRKSVVGVLCAAYLGPVGTPVLNLALGAINVPPEHALSASGFVMGIGGVVVIEIILKTLRIRRDRLSGGKDENAGQ